MIKKYFRQALAQLRQHPLISIISMLGTAMAIFLIMLVVMMQQVKVAPFAPESRRDRFLHIENVSMTHRDWGAGNTSNGPMSAQTARECFQRLTTPEEVTIYSCNYILGAVPLSLPGQPSVSADLRQTDDRYWRVFDFSFIDGKPFDRAAFDAGQPVAVITESVARALFGTATGVAGREFQMNHAPYRVAGVVRDVSTLATVAYAQIWVPFTSTDIGDFSWTGDHMGLMSATILAHSRKDFGAIREECARRLAEYNAVIGADGWEIIPRGRPYDQEKQSISFDASGEPDLDQARRRHWVVYLILLIVPAINLSSMTQSRLRQRVAEIGVRRAFGSTRLELMGQIVTENLIVTLLAGAVGLLMSVAFAYLGASLLFAQEFTRTLNPPQVDALILLQGSTFGWAVLFCFVLNLLSTGFPAWRASRIGIVDALDGRLYSTI